MSHRPPRDEPQASRHPGAVPEIRRAARCACAVIAMALAACDPGAGGDADSGPPTDDTGPTILADPPYASILELHDVGIARTCSLNNGVCHNSSSYPDLRSPSSLIASAPLPCGLSAVTREAIPNECEQPGDRFVVPSASFDEEVIDFEIAEIDPMWDAPSRVTLTFDADVTGLTTAARGFELHRGTRVFTLAPAENVRIEAIDGRDVTLAITHYRGGPIERFFDVRGLAYANESVIRWADANGDGVHGNAAPHPMIVPGDARGSYIVMRLTDPSFGELMPRQCRTWDDQATRALACWIEGLTTDASGAIDNAYEPIDYQSCDVVLPAGRCGGAALTGFAAVESVLGRHCGGTGCHIGEAVPSAGLDLSMGRARESLDRTSIQQPAMRLVAAGSLDESYLWCKLSETCGARGTTARMPLTGMLSAEELAVIRTWIESGAP
jgi:hypothetical protein